jgi:hypothetical protein
LILRLESNQNGQALIESVLMMMTLIALLFAIQLTGQLRSQSIDLLGESSFQTFMLTQKKLTSESWAIGTQAIQKDRLGPYPVADRMLDKVFSKQLLDVHQGGLVGVKSAKGRLHRSSYLLINAGESDSALEMQRRIEHSKEAWTHATRISQRSLGTLRDPLGRVDAPWARERLSTDWLRRWAEVKP